MNLSQFIFTTVNRKVPYEEYEQELYLYFLKLIDPKLLKWMQEAEGPRRQFRRGESKFFWSREDSEKLYRIAFHEAGHVVAYWFTKGPAKIRLATIISGNGYRGRVSFEETDEPFEETPENIFSIMCCYFGGGIAAQMMYPFEKPTLAGMSKDIINITINACKLAGKTRNETTERDIMKLMYFYIRRCYEVTKNILKEHKKDLKAVTYALFTEKELDYDALLEILGPRPQMEKTLYEELIKDKVYFDETTSLPVHQVNKSVNSTCLKWFGKPRITGNSVGIV